jgi:hypothetical protein
MLWNRSATADQVLQLIEQYPAALMYRDLDDQLPIHIECQRQSRPSILLRCIELYPESVSEPGKYGYLPLHSLLRSEGSSVDAALVLIQKYPAALKRQDNSKNDFPLHLECDSQCRAFIVSKSIELYPEALDNKAISVIAKKINQNNFRRFLPALRVIFTAHPMSFYTQAAYIEDGILEDPYFYRRRILNILPRHVFAPNHEADYRDLNWQPRSTILMLLSQIQQRNRQQGSSSTRSVNAVAADLDQPSVREDVEDSVSIDSSLDP